MSFFDILLLLHGYIKRQIISCGNWLFCALPQPLSNVKSRKLFHVTCIVLIACMSIFHFIYRVNGLFYAGDSVGYQAHIRSIVESGVAVVVPLSYNELSKKTIGQTSARIQHSYPNKGFQLAVSLVSWIRGEFGDINADILNFVMTFLLALALYGLGYHISKSYILATLLSIGVLFDHTIMLTAYNGTSEQGFLFFLTVSLWAAISGKCLLAGTLLGIGAFYRQQMLLFVPFIVLWLPLYDSFKDFIRKNCFVAIGLFFGLLAYCIAEYRLAPNSADLFYFSGRGSVFWNNKISNVNSELLSEYLMSFFRVFFPLLAGLLLYSICKFRKAPYLVKGFLITGIATCFLSAFSVFPYHTFEPRLMVSFILLLWLVLLVWIEGLRFRVCFMLLFFIASFLLNPPPARRDWQMWFSEPAARWSSITAPERKSNSIFKTIKPRPVTLTSRAMLPERFMSKPSTFYLPKFSNFLNGENNHLIDVIIYREQDRGEWPSVADDELGYIIDSHENKFVRIPGLPYNTKEWVRLNCFIRVSDSDEND